MVRQANLFDRAAHCQRALDLASDPEERIALKVLCDMWTALANESVALSNGQLAKEIAAIEELQSSIVGPGKTAAPSADPDGGEAHF